MTSLQNFKYGKLIKLLNLEFNTKHNNINSECLSLFNTCDEITKLYKNVPNLEFDNQSEIIKILVKTNALYTNKINDFKILNKEIENYLHEQSLDFL